MLKRLVLTVFIGFIVVVLALGSVLFNLKNNSVYYAQNTPHKKGVEPVLMELVRNLRWVSNPDIEGIKYDFDGNNVIKNTNSAGRTTALAYYYDETYRYYDGGGANAYKFDKQFRFISIWNRKTRKYVTKISDLSQVKRDIYRTVQPVIDAQPEPLINLQWIYDWVNKDRFN
ncbi:hypothetical protein [Varibaculum prostatecancerukia]|uniref:hypothetical protein n=1 Tax=Varibaculum prostatecancerukia TaxID=2811781 RepID=UPI001C006A4D|nr:hypothetical protein [Varibaculum prostatecancerukia]